MGEVYNSRPAEANHDDDEIYKNMTVFPILIMIYSNNINKDRNTNTIL